MHRPLSALQRIKDLSQISAEVRKVIVIARSAHPEVVVTEGDAENLPYPHSFMQLYQASESITFLVRN
jgi:hypothetical protein